MVKILTPIIDKNGKATNVWRTATTGNPRIDRITGGLPSGVSFGDHDIATTRDMDALCRLIDEAAAKGKLDLFAAQFAASPHLPVLYQTYLMQECDSPELTAALVRNPNVSVSVIEEYHRRGVERDETLVHPLLPIELAENGLIRNGPLEDLVDNPAYSERALKQIRRINEYRAQRNAAV